MSRVAIETVDGKKAGAVSIFDEIKALSERIRERAFEIFQARGGGDGRAMDDWANAERDLLWTPESELIDRDGRFEVQVAAPGFDPGEVRVMALPDALIVKASRTETNERNEDNVQAREAARKTLFCRFDLPEPIDPGKVTANLEKGVLCLTALKANQEAAPKEKARAA